MRGAPLAILVIDENKLRASIIEAGLREVGHESVAVIHDVTGIAARIAEMQPDVIVTDLENPNRDMLENMFQLSRAVKRPIAMFVDRADTASIEAAVDAAFPLALNTDRLRDQWHTMTRTGNMPRLMANAPEPIVDLHSRDAAANGLVDGDLAHLSTRYGFARAKVRVSDVQWPGQALEWPFCRQCRRGGGRIGRKALRSAAVPSFPTLVRKIPAYEIIPDEAVELIHQESLAILEEIGCEFRDDEAIAMWKQAGADVSGTRVRLDRHLLMDLVSKVPSEFTLNARNPERSVKIGGKNTIFVPMYGAPYVRDLDNNWRYGTLEDLQNFHKLAYMAPALHSSSSIICEPMEIAVPKRHLHIIHSALKHSDKPFMGIVTSKDRAEDTMAMAGIVFGEDFVRDNAVLVSITNCNSPLVWDATMLDAMKVYARNNQPLILAPFALCGASTSASSVGAVAQMNAEVLAGVAFTQLIRPGSPQIYGQFMVTVDMKTGAPMGGTPEAAQMMYLMGALARKYRLPWRTSGFHVGSKLNDAQAGYEANMLMHAAILAGANYIWHSAGWLEAGLTCGYSKFATDCEQLVGWYKYAGGVPFDDFKEAMAAIREVGPQGHFLGTQHTLDHFESAFFMPTIMDFNSFEQWKAEGAKDHDTRGREKARNMLLDYEEPKLAEDTAEALRDFVARREKALPDMMS